MKNYNQNKEIITNFSILLISCIVTLLLMEIIVRIFIPQVIETPMNFYVYDEMLGWKLKPNFKKIFTYPDYKMDVITNEHGFRDISHSYEKPMNSFRIVGIGDSFLFGYGINYEDNVLVRLQELLYNNNLLSKKVEVINLGIPGYDMDQYYKILKYESYKYNPDLVILFFYTNDWTNGTPSTRKVNSKGFLLTGEKFSFESIRAFFFPLRVFLKTHSQLYILVRGRIKEILMKAKLMQIPPISLYKKNNNFQKKFSYTFELLNKIQEFCEKNMGCTFLICIVPEKLQVKKSYLEIIKDAYCIDERDYNWLQPQIMLTNFCLGKKINFLDLTRAFSLGEEKQELYFDIDPHWNKEGHLLAANEIYRFIKEKGITGARWPNEK